MDEIRYIDLFSGIGGFRLGLEKSNDISSEQPRTQSGRWNENKEKIPNGHSSKPSSESGSYPRELRRFRCVWSCDWDKDANYIYYKRFKPKQGEHYPGDIGRVSPKNIPDFDLLCAGFPCPSFSLAGPRSGFKDERGEVFFTIPRIAEAKRPKMLLLENVLGLLSNDRGRTFQVILNSLEALGYWVEWQVLNSKYFGVPQNRERVFIIGHLGRERTRAIFPIGETDEISESENTRKTKPVIGVTLANISRYNQGVSRTPLKQDDTSFALNSAGDQGVAISFTNPHNPSEERKINLSSESRSVKPPYGNQQPLVLRPKDDWFLQHAIYDESGLAPTLRGSQHDSSPRITDNLRIRRLTPVECERLQGFPDGWTAGLPDSARSKLLGKAVTVNVIEFLGRRLWEFLTNGNGEKK